MNHPNRSKNSTAPKSPKPAELLRVREAAGLTQTEAAGILGMTLNAWQRWESGERPMSPALWDLFQRRLNEKTKALWFLVFDPKRRPFSLQRWVEGIGMTSEKPPQSLLKHVEETYGAFSTEAFTFQSLDLERIYWPM